VLQCKFIEERFCCFCLGGVGAVLHLLVVNDYFIFCMTNEQSREVAHYMYKIFTAMFFVTFVLFVQPNTMRPQHWAVCLRLLTWRFFCSDLLMQNSSLIKHNRCVVCVTERRNTVKGGIHSSVHGKHISTAFTCRARFILSCIAATTGSIAKYSAADYYVCIHIYDCETR